MRIHPIFLLGLWAAACSDSPADPNPGGSGELGAGTFTYLCRSEGDFTCTIGQITASFPQRFVEGGRFGLAYAWKDEQEHINEPLPALQSAAPERLAFSADTFTAKAPGYAAILAATGNSKVVDLIHANIRVVDDLRLVDAAFLPGVAPLDKVVLPISGTTIVQLIPLDLDDVPLAGAVDVAWSLDSDTVAVITAGQSTGRVRVEALAAGDVTLTATLGDKQVDVDITVDPALGPTTSETDAAPTDPTLTTTTDTTGDTTGDTTNDTTTDTGTTSETTDTTDTTTGGVL